MYSTVLAQQGRIQKLFWDRQIGLEWLETTKRDTEGDEGEG